jgi:RNA polymerase sigma factor (sigma-70 family)
MSPPENAAYLDGLLLQALRQDDEKALSYLFATHYNKLFRLGLKWSLDSYLTEECIQLIFSDLWRYRNTIGEIQSFEAYLKSSLRKRISTELTRQNPTHRLNLDEAELLLLPTHSYEEVLVQQEGNELTKQKLRQALEQLTTRQKEVVVMKYFEEKTYKEITELTGLQVDTIYKILHEALKKLRIILS